MNAPNQIAIALAHDMNGHPNILFNHIKEGFKTSNILVNITPRNWLRPYLGPLFVRNG